MPTNMTPFAIPPQGLPRLPLPGWALGAGPRATHLPCIADASHTFLTTSGRAAIALALRCLNIGQSDRVLVPTYHCPAMIVPVVALGATPVFYPIDERGTPAPERLSVQELAGVRAMLTPHYFGFPQPMSRIRAFCDQRGIALIEDCAHAMFGECEGRPMGQWGDYAIASIPKFFPATDGGILVTARRPAAALVAQRMPLKAEIKALANFLETGARHGGFPGANGLLRKLFSLRGQAVAPAAASTRSAAAVACHWLEFHGRDASPLRRPSAVTRWVLGHGSRERIVERRRENYQLLARLFADTAAARPLFPLLPDTVAPYVFPLWVDQPDRIYHAVKARGLPVFRWDDVWPHAAAAGVDDHGPRWSHHIFQLGCHQDLSARDIHAMAKVLGELLSARGNTAQGDTLPEESV